MQNYVTNVGVSQNKLLLSLYSPSRYCPILSGSHVGYCMSGFSLQGGKRLAGPRNLQ